MLDRIDERDKQERMHRSIVKYWNVNYIPTPYAEPKEEQTGVSETVEQISQDISYITGVIRTPEYDEEPEETQGEEEPEDDGSTPVITDVSQSQTGENETQE